MTMNEPGAGVSSMRAVPALPLFDGLETVTIRYFNVFGPRQDPGSPYSGVISLFVDALVEGRAPKIYGDGRQTRSFVYIDDFVDGFPNEARERFHIERSRDDQDGNLEVGFADTLNEVVAIAVP